MAKFGLVEPFDIDDGQLSGLSPAECFVLGVEWQMVAEQAAQPDAFERPIHRRNVERLQRLLIRRQRRFTVRHDTDEWSTLAVGERE